jgi:hypothetical protein
MSLPTRKRPPLVQRPSYSESNSDWRETCKTFAGFAGDDEGASTLVSMILDSSPSDRDSVLHVQQLMVSRIPKFILSQDARGQLCRHLHAWSLEPSPFVFPLVRLLVKQNRNHSIDWPISSSRLISMEITAWDSLSDGHVNKVGVTKRALESGNASDLELEAALIPEISDLIWENPIFGACRKLIRWDSVGDIESCLEQLSLSSDDGYRNIFLSLFLNIAVWSSKLSGDKELTISAIEKASKLDMRRLFSAHIRFVQCQFGVPIAEDFAQEFRATKLLASVNLGEPLAQHSSVNETENRYEVALLCMHLGLRCEARNDFIGSTIYALHALHSLKFSEACRAKLHSGYPKGLEGLLSLRFSDKAIQAVVPLVPPLQKIFITMESVRIATTAYERIGYIPGASWLLQRAIEYIKVFHEDRFFMNRLKRFDCMFRNRLRFVHSLTPTAIPDNIARDFESIDDCEEDLKNSPLEVCCGISERLNNLRSIVIGQHVLLSKKELSHLARLDLVKTISGEHGPARTRSTGFLVTFSVDKNDSLWISLNEGPREKLIDQDATELVLNMIKEMNELLLTNKDMIDSTQDSKEFWNDRRAIDSEFGSFLERMQTLLFNNSKALIDLTRVIETEQLIFLDLPDLLLSLAIEALPVFRKTPCVRALWLNSTRSRSSRCHTKCSYVVNPSSSSEAAILSVLHENGWEGSAGSPTLSDSAFSDLLKNTSNVFLYSGHGGGEKHWSGSLVQRLCLHSSAPRIALLMGCSSAKPYGDYRATFCTPFHYLIGGVRMVVGTLWDVLGRELDRLTVHAVKNLPANPEIRDLVNVVKEGKGLMKLENLSAASLVVYVNLAQD